MTVFLALAMAGALAAPSGDEAPCPDGSTLDMNACFGKRLDAAEADLARYLATALKRLKEESVGPQGDPAAAAASRELQQAETAWTRYRDAACGAVYSYWSAGTIRDVKSLDCQIRLTRRHTHDVWLQWLTYMDSTPPLLPEPPVPTGG